MKRLFTLLLCLVLLSVAAGPVLSAEKVRLQLKWFHQFQFAGYYAALEKGFFAEEGLEVELLERDPAVNNILQVLDGEVEYSIADSALLLYQEQGAGLRIVAPIFQHSPNVIITLASSGIETPQDLAGRRIRQYDNETEGFSIMAMLAEQGVIERGFVRQPFSADADALLRGETDAIFGYSSNEPFSYRQRGIAVRLINPAHYGIDMYGDMLFTSEQEAREHPERVAAMRRAVLRGWAYALDNKAEIARLILARYNPDKSFEALMFEAEAIEHAVARFVVPLGTFDQGRLQYIANIYARHGLLEQHFSHNRKVFFDRAPAGERLLSDEEEAFLAQLPRIRVGIDPTWFPLDFVDANGNHSGIAADYLEQLSRRLGVTFEVVTDQPWSRTLELMKARELDILAMAANTPDRSVYASFTRPYLRSPMVIVTKVEVDYIDGAAGLRGRTVGVADGYASHEWLRQNYPELELVIVDTTTEGLERVATGEVFAYVDNLASVSFLIKQQGYSNLKISGQLPIAFDLAMGARNDWPLLRGILQKGLDSISQQEKDAIYDRWIRLEMDTAFDYRKVAPFFLGLLVIVLIMALDGWRMRQLHAKVRRANEDLRLAEDRLKQQYHLLEQVSVTDKLTGVYNRFKLDAVLGEQMARSQRYQRPLTMILFDLDHFKQVNDGYGHNVGDLVLRTFAEVVNHSVRKTDVFGRWGGEEFLLICPETTVDDAVELANKIRLQIAEVPFEGGLVQTVSGGVAELREGQSLDEWIRHCDKLLYQAKQQGRNRVVSG